MKTFMRFLRPMAFLRRKAIFAGLIGGSRKWMIWGGAAWVFRLLGRVFGVGDPKPRYTEEITAGERVFVVHEPLSVAGKKKAARKEAKAQRRALKAARKAAKNAS